MQKGDITFQTSELGAVDVGGGGTIAFILGNLNMDVIDAGIAVHDMHARVRSFRKQMSMKVTGRTGPS